MALISIRFEGQGQHFLCYNLIPEYFRSSHAPGSVLTQTYLVYAGKWTGGKIKSLNPATFPLRGYKSFPPLSEDV